MRVGETYIPYTLTGELRTFHWLLRRPLSDLSQGAKLAFLRLAEYAGSNGACYPSPKTLGDELGVGMRAANGYIRELRDRRILAPARQDNQYVFIVHPWMLGLEMPEGQCKNVHSECTNQHSECTDVHSPATTSVQGCALADQTSPDLSADSVQGCALKVQGCAPAECKDVHSSLEGMNGTLSCAATGVPVPVSVQGTSPPPQERPPEFSEAMNAVQLVWEKHTAKTGMRMEDRTLMVPLLDAGLTLADIEAVLSEKLDGRGHLRSNGKEVHSISYFIPIFRDLLRARKQARQGDTYGNSDSNQQGRGNGNHHARGGGRPHGGYRQDHGASPQGGSSLKAPANWDDTSRADAQLEAYLKRQSAGS